MVALPAFNNQTLSSHNQGLHTLKEDSLKGTWCHPNTCSNFLKWCLVDSHSFLASKRHILINSVWTLFSNNFLNKEEVRCQVKKLLLKMTTLNLLRPVNLSTEVDNNKVGINNSSHIHSSRCTNNSINSSRCRILNNKTLTCTPLIPTSSRYCHRLAASKECQIIIIINLVNKPSSSHNNNSRPSRVASLTAKHSNSNYSNRIRRPSKINNRIRCHGSNNSNTWISINNSNNTGRRQRRWTRNSRSKLRITYTVSIHCTLSSWVMIKPSPCLANNLLTLVNNQWISSTLNSSNHLVSLPLFNNNNSSNSSNSSRNLHQRMSCNIKDRVQTGR